MNNTENRFNEFLKGNTSPEETLSILEQIALNPELEEYVVNRRRSDYSGEQLEDYGSFIPAGSNAALNGNDNLCDFQCEMYILKKDGKNVGNNSVKDESRKNYWLTSQGTPLFNMGKILETNGMLVNRLYNVTIEELKSYLKDYRVIAVVNEEILAGKTQDVLSDNFSVESDPNHAVVVLSISEDDTTVDIYNPATEDDSTQYPLSTFLDAWNESSNYIVTSRPKAFPEEYNPQPIDVSSVTLNPELQDLTEMIAENAHDIWAVDKFQSGFKYAHLDASGNEEKGCNHYLVPYIQLDEKDKEPDRKMAINTIKLVKRLGYRLVNINSMYRCPHCGEVIEPSYNFCPDCGESLSWKDFR